MGKVVWTLTKEELNEIQELFEKKLALENLIKIIDPTNEKMYIKLTTDYGQNMRLFQKWWSDISRKYKWEGGNWSINFETYEVLSQ